MNDIAFQLRNNYNSGVLWLLCTQAADEIVRLEDKCKHLESEIARLERCAQ